MSCAAKNLELDPRALGEVILKRQVKVGTDVTDIPLDIVQAMDNRDALAKQLYSNLFEYVVYRINKCLNITDSNKEFDLEIQKNAKIIGLLDIFGFEIFKQNSFEQLCINYTNEKVKYY